MKNSKGNVYYGLHMYPGVAEYKEHGEGFRVLVNEDTIRKMGPTFAGRPVFVMHVDEVSDDIDTLKSEADGWVIESFFNEADGKHWAKFIIVSDKGDKAIKSGYRLSNCYTPKAFERGGEWNAVAYQKEVVDGEYEHLAIVPNPRYEESVILTPDEFKAYNESKRQELLRLANDNGGKSVKLSLFKKQKVENSSDLENMVVLLPKSGREVEIMTLVKEADEAQVIKNSGATMYADEGAMVKVGENEMSVGDLANAYLEKCKAEGAAELQNEDDDDDDDEDDLENEDDLDVGDELENEDDDEDDELENSDDEDVARKEREAKELKNKNAKAKAEKLRNAHRRGNYEDAAQKVFDPTGGVQLGKARYGS